jgi:thiosulfate dehydrogenase
MNGTPHDIDKLNRAIRQVYVRILLFFALVIGIFVLMITGMPALDFISNDKNPPTLITNVVAEDDLDEDAKEGYWRPADINLITDPVQKELVLYGKELVAHTAKYLGPQGIVMQNTNKLNCQNCHLDAGTKVFGNNYGSVASTYPRYRPRSGTEENVYKRVNDCVERSLNGTALDTTSREMQAIVAYILYIGSNVPKGEKAKGSGLKDMAFLDRAADPKLGKIVYQQKCVACHQPNGEGLKLADATEYMYPPLWGEGTYNDAAGLYRLSNFAKYAKYNMPQGTNHRYPQLSDEEAWDVAAFVNSMQHPHKETPQDWPNIAEKPIDHPRGPFADGFSDEQHKYGPFKPIIEKREADKLAGK